jgi:hypothetical protein
MASSNSEQILKGGRRLLCANLADPACAGATHSRGPAATAALGLSAGHRPPPFACGSGAVSHTDMAMVSSLNI